MDGFGAQCGLGWGDGRFDSPSINKPYGTMALLPIPFRPRNIFNWGQTIYGMGRCDRRLNFGDQCGDGC